MKKIILTILLAALALTPTLPADAAEYVNIATGASGGTYYPVGSAMAKIWNTHVPGVKATAQSSGGTRNNIELLGDGEAEVAIVDGLSYDAYHGLNTYKGTPKTYLRAMAPLYFDVVHVLTARGSGVKTLADLKGKRVAVGVIGGSVSLVAAEMFRRAGVILGKDARQEHLSHTETAAAFADRRIDAAVVMGSLGISSVMEPTTVGLVEILSLPDDFISDICRDLPYYSPFVIPADTYRGQDEPKKTFGSLNILAAHEKLDNALVRNMTRALFANKPDLVAVTKTLEAMSADDAGKMHIPPHPGAVEYYNETAAR